MKDWIPLIAAIIGGGIVVIGWFANSEFNKRNEIKKRLLEHRLTALKSVVENILFELSKGADNAFKKPDFIDKLENARATIQMFGYRNEIEIYEEFINAINMKSNDDEAKSDRLKKVNECIPKLTIILESLRTELGLENYKRT